MSNKNVLFDLNGLFARLEQELREMRSKTQAWLGGEVSLATINGYMQAAGEAETLAAVCIRLRAIEPTMTDPMLTAAGRPTDLQTNFTALKNAAQPLRERITAYLGAKTVPIVQVTVPWDVLTPGVKARVSDFALELPTAKRTAAQAMLAPGSIVFFREGEIDLSDFLDDPATAGRVSAINSLHAALTAAGIT